MIERGNRMTPKPTDLDQREDVRDTRVAHHKATTPVSPKELKAFREEVLGVESGSKEVFRGERDDVDVTDWGLNGKHK